MSSMISPGVTNFNSASYSVAKKDGKKYVELDRNHMGILNTYGFF